MQPRRHLRPRPAPAAATPARWVRDASRTRRADDSPAEELPSNEPTETPFSSVRIFTFFFLLMSCNENDIRFMFKLLPLTRDRKLVRNLGRFEPFFFA